MRSRKRLVALVLLLFAGVFIAAALYHAGMERLEHKPRTYLESLEWAAETISTTGYGADSRWKHPAMELLVILTQFAGMIVVPLFVYVIALPYIVERFAPRLPREADRSLVHHVIVYRNSPTVETLLQRLSERHVPLLVAETDEAQARIVLENHQNIVFSRSEDDILASCRVEAARAIVTNGCDEENAGIVLRARQMGFRGDIYAFVEDPAHRKAIELAGATYVYTPRHIVAAALAAHASDTLSPRLPGLEMLTGYSRREIRVPYDSPVAGKSVGASGIGRDSGAVIVGQWSHSNLETHCTAAMRIDGGAVLEIVGDEESLERAARAIGSHYLHDTGPFLLAGFGEVGRKVHELLTDVGDEVCVIERNPAPGVDHVGDVLDSSVLANAGAAKARAIILALNSDDATLFGTVIARDVAPDVPVLARVNHGRNINNLHRAGADYALSISDISGEMLSSRLLGRAARAREEKRRVTRIPARRWAGRPIDHLPIRENTCSVLAIERRGAFLKPAQHFIVEANDTLWVCGSAESLHRLA